MDNGQNNPDIHAILQEPDCGCGARSKLVDVIMSHNNWLKETCGSLREFYDEFDQMKEIVKSNKSQNHILQKESSRLQEEITCLQEEMTRQQENITRLQEDNARLREDNTRLQEEKVRLRNEIGDTDNCGQTRESRTTYQN